MLNTINKNMKKIILSITILFAVSLFMPVMAQQTEKEAGKALNKKAMKKARKEAKQLKKDGFFVPPGALPMDIQIENAWKKRPNFCRRSWIS